MIFEKKTKLFFVSKFVSSKPKTIQHGPSSQVGDCLFTPNGADRNHLTWEDEHDPAMLPTNTYFTNCNYF